jgi:hypothetical protein
MRKIYIYILGVTLLGLVQGFIKSAIPHGAVLLFIVVAYLLILGLIAEKFGKP